MSAPGGGKVVVTKDNIASLSFYDIFHLRVTNLEEASATVIATSDVQKLYRRYALLFHPDKDGSEAARTAFERVKLALDTFLDPAKKTEYDNVLFAAPEAGTSASSAEAQRQQAAEADAAWAERILRQKEASQAAAKAALQRAAEVREQAAQNILHELTHTLQTPLRQMEADMIRDWDVTPETLAMKQQDIEKLLAALRSGKSPERTHAGAEAAESRKRPREAV